MTKANGKKIKILKGEKFIYFLLGMAIILAPVTSVYTKATLSETNIAKEKLKINIDKQTGVNEALEMQINELASLDKIQQVAKELGLYYNEGNVKIIAD